MIDKQDVIELTRVQRYQADLGKAKQELEVVQSRLEDIDQEKAELEARRSKLQTTIEVLAPICYDLAAEEGEQWVANWAEISKAGIQECCYRLLLEEGEPLTAAIIRIRLEDRGVKFEQQNPLAVIHTSLKRIPERVRSYKKQEWVGESQTRVAWVRYYEAIRQSTDSKDSVVAQQ